MNNKIDLPTVEIVLLCIESLVKNRKKCSFGELIKECFKLYPSVFALTDVTKWPDTLKLDRALRGLREKGYISGSPVTYYTITNLGYRVLDSLKYKVYGNTIGQEIRSTRSPDLLLLQKIKKSEDFNRYLNGKTDFRPNNMRIREVIKFTLETPSQI